MTAPIDEGRTEPSTAERVAEIETIKRLVREIDRHWKNRLRLMESEVTYQGYLSVIIPFFDDWAELVTPLQSFVDEREAALRAQLAEEEAAAPPPAQDPPPGN